MKIIKNITKMMALFSALYYAPADLPAIEPETEALIRKEELFRRTLPEEQRKIYNKIMGALQARSESFEGEQRVLLQEITRASREHREVFAGMQNRLRSAESEAKWGKVKGYLAGLLSRGSAMAIYLCQNPDAVQSAFFGFSSGLIYVLASSGLLKDFITASLRDVNADAADLA